MIEMEEQKWAYWGSKCAQKSVLRAENITNTLYQPIERFFALETTQKAPLYALNSSPKAELCPNSRGL